MSSPPPERPPPTIDAVRPFLICPLCSGIFKDAHTIQDCLHTFCRECLFRRLEEKPLCPICGIDLGLHPEELIHADHKIQTVVDLIFPSGPGKRRVFRQTAQKSRSSFRDAGSSLARGLFWIASLVPRGCIPSPMCTHVSDSDVSTLHLNSRGLSSEAADDLLREAHDRASGIFFVALFENNLTTLPDILFDFSALSRLECDHNKIVLLPALVGRLIHLRSLALHDNLLVELPPQIGSLTELEELRLDRNRLARLPAEMGCLRALHVLHLEGNRLVDLPLELGALHRLAELLIGAQDPAFRLSPQLRAQLQARDCLVID
ncbi:putative E3 ubiquitin-protein ligase DRIP [Paratrimastix pyriformis]|uniref:E3 ubiquitin-protein ligase DRIP n=1 Tax=Paratrimastix pyriformis TaxID=342808 RepID=A0ABQ8UEU2_9EUKA|nr:putative E3 ubiquitin-protein ligase DRIP [Paratrimastix pyriformis]